MSPTRRDVLKSFAITTIAVALPKQAIAAPDTLEADTTVDDAISDHLLSFAALSDHISAEHQEIQERLVRHATRAGVWLEEETPGTFIARRHGVTGHCEIVTKRSCSCQRFRLWHRCEHNALLRSITQREEGA